MSYPVRVGRPVYTLLVRWAGSQTWNDWSGGSAPSVLEPTQLQHRPAEPEPLLHREAVPGAAHAQLGATGSTVATLASLAPRTTTFLGAHNPRTTGHRRPTTTAGLRVPADPETTTGTRTTTGPGSPAGARDQGGLVDPVAECRSQQSAEARNVLHRHPERPDAAVALPDAQHDQVPLRVPGDTQPSPALVEEHIPAGRQCSRVLHRPRVVALGLVFKAPGRRPAPTSGSGRGGSTDADIGLFHILGGVVLFGCPGG